MRGIPRTRRKTRARMVKKRRKRRGRRRTRTRMIKKRRRRREKKQSSTTRSIRMRRPSSGQTTHSIPGNI